MNQVSLLGEKKINHQMIRRILNSMSKSYARLIALMQEIKDLKNISLTNFVGSLISHETKYLLYEEPIQRTYFERIKITKFGHRSNKLCNTCKMNHHKEEDYYLKKWQLNIV